MPDADAGEETKNRDQYAQETSFSAAKFMAPLSLTVFAVRVSAVAVQTVPKLLKSYQAGTAPASPVHDSLRGWAGYDMCEVTRLRGG